MSLTVLPSSRLHFEIQSEDGRLYVMYPCLLPANLHYNFIPWFTVRVHYSFFRS